MTKPTAAEASLSRQTFDRLRDLVREHAGIDFPDEKQYLLESRVKPRLMAQEVPDFETYADRLEQGDTREIARLVNAVTINETAFFRHPSQFEALEDTILPELVRLHQQERSGPMRLWSAACSAGDEAYSLAILIRETIGPRHPRMDYEIVGTDIDTEVLEEARAGRYRKRSVRNVPPAYLRDYFDRSGEAFVVDPAIRDMVEFRPPDRCPGHAADAQLRPHHVCQRAHLLQRDIQKERAPRAVPVAPSGRLLVRRRLGGARGARRPAGARPPRRRACLPAPDQRVGLLASMTGTPRR